VNTSLLALAQMFIVDFQVILVQTEILPNLLQAIPADPIPVQVGTLKLIKGSM
jgi:hypothetical protein